MDRKPSTAALDAYLDIQFDDWASHLPVDTDDDEMLSDDQANFMPEPEDDPEQEGEGDESDSGSGTTGKGGGKRPKALKDYKVVIDSILRDALTEGELNQKETILKKLLLLVVAPFSGVVPGASALSSENDLARKLYLGRIGLHNKQISPSDIADPDLIRKLEERLKDRLHRLGLEDARWQHALEPVGGLSGAIVAGAAAIAAEGADKKDKKLPNKAKRDQDAEDDDDFETDDDSYEAVSTSAALAAEISAMQAPALVPDTVDDVVTAVVADLTADEDDQANDFGEFLSKYNFTKVLESKADVPTREASLTDRFNYQADEREEPVQAIELHHELELRRGAGGPANPELAPTA